jgi:hypothetical protein
MFALKGFPLMAQQILRDAVNRYNNMEYNIIWNKYDGINMMEYNIIWNTLI